jgi:hypothetical protein
MTLALLTRGYICAGRGGPSVFGPGPGIVSTNVMSPEIRASGADRDLVPEILGAGSQIPVASGSASATVPISGVGTPQIVGGSDLSPDIKSR